MQTMCVSYMTPRTCFSFSSGLATARIHSLLPPNMQRLLPAASKPVLLCLAAAVALRMLVSPLYYSTDFEVHRNWMAITHSLPLAQWYRDTTSPWTLDYPPLFAWFEFVLSTIASAFHPQMLALQQAAYESWHVTVLQRSSVIACDLVMFACAWALGGSLTTISRTSTRDSHKPRAQSSPNNPRAMLVALVSLHAGPVIVDNIHFQ